jgi:hypothetical protein
MVTRDIAVIGRGTSGKNITSIRCDLYGSGNFTSITAITLLPLEITGTVQFYDPAIFIIINAIRAVKAGDIPVIGSGRTSKDISSIRCNLYTVCPAAVQNKKR